MYSYGHPGSHFPIVGATRLHYMQPTVTRLRLLFHKSCSLTKICLAKPTINTDNINYGRTRLKPKQQAFLEKVYYKYFGEEQSVDCYFMTISPYWGPLFICCWALHGQEGDPGYLG